jgi:hypothetical protein
MCAMSFMRVRVVCAQLCAGTYGDFPLNRTSELCGSIGVLMAFAMERSRKRLLLVSMCC